MPGRYHGSGYQPTDQRLIAIATACRDALPKSPVIMIKTAPAAPLARRQRRAQPWGGPPVARRATLAGQEDQRGSCVTPVGRTAVFLAFDRPAGGRRGNGRLTGPAQAIGYASRPGDIMTRQRRGRTPVSTTQQASSAGGAKSKARCPGVGNLSRLVLTPPGRKAPENAS